VWSNLINKLLIALFIRLRILQTVTVKLRILQTVTVKLRILQTVTELRDVGVQPKDKTPHFMPRSNETTSVLHSEGNEHNCH
jgi:hypothetical protein